MIYARYVAGMNDFKYCVSLNITHPSIDPELISEKLNLSPEMTFRQGEVQPSDSTQHYEYSYWKVTFDVQDGKSVAEFLERMVFQLKPRQSFLQQIHQEGAEIECFVGIFVDELCDQVYPHQLLADLAQLHINLRLDQYRK